MHQSLSKWDIINEMTFHYTPPSVVKNYLMHISSHI